MAEPANQAVKVDRFRDRRGVWGIGFAAAFILSLLLAAALATGSLPLPDDPVDDVVAYTRDNEAVIVLVAALQALSAIALWRFVPAVTTLVERYERGPVRIALLAGAVSAVSLAFSAVFTIVQVVIVSADSRTGVGLVRDLTYYLGGVMHLVSLAPVIGIHAWPAARGRLPVRWLGIVGMIAVVACYLTILSPFISATTVFLPLGRLLAFVWSVGVGILLLRGAHRPSSASGQPGFEPSGALQGTVADGSPGTPRSR